MSSIVIAGDTSGTVTLQAPAVAGSTVLTLPTGTGTVTVAGVNSNIVSGTAVTPSTTVVEFTGIPSWAKRITILLNGVVASSTSNLLVQIGSNTFTTSGYAGFVFLGATARSAMSTGFMITALRAATSSVNGSIVLSLVTGNTWNEVGLTTDGDASVLGSSQSSGNLTLGGVLDRVRVTSVSANTFSAGTINIMYE